jgi:hypothetical protein
VQVALDEFLYLASAGHYNEGDVRTDERVRVGLHPIASMSDDARPPRRSRRARRGHVWALLASVMAAGCASGAARSAPTGPPPPPPPLRQLLLTGSGARSYDPCQGSYFSALCASAVGSAGVTFDSPPVQEFVFQYRSTAAAAGAERSQQSKELSSDWLCSMPSQCPVEPVAVGPANLPVHAVTFTIGQRGNLSETTHLAAVAKGSYVVDLSWLSASMLSANRVTPPSTAQALLEEALNKIPA